MSRSDIPYEIEEFLYRYISSVEQLEILMLLKATCPKEWTAQGIFTELRSNLNSVRLRIEALANHALITTHVSDETFYSYGAQNPEQGRLLEKVLATFVTRRVRIIEMIYKSPGDSLIQFSNSFRF